MLVVRHTTMLVLVPAGQDKVVAWAPIPMGGKLISVHGELHVIGAEAAPTNNFQAFGFSGEMVPLTDPDSVLSLDTLWDNMVTKTVIPETVANTNKVDFDWDSTDATPDVEPGEVDVNDLTGLLDPGKSIIDPVLEWLSSAKGTPMAVVAGTPDTYTPRSYKRFRSQRTLVADLSSYALLAVSSPSLDSDTITQSTLGIPKDWAILENLRNVMNDFWRINVGLTEAGAETPYTDISVAIGNLVSPLMVNPSASLLDAMQWTVLCSAQWLIEIQGTSVPQTLDAKNE